MRRFAIHVEGYTGETFEARTASAARYAAYKAFCEATNRIPFRDFLARISTLHLGKAEQGA